MPLTIKNLKNDRIINLGTINGHMICLAPGQEMGLTKEESDLFENRIITYAEGGFISVTKTSDEIIQSTVLPDEPLPKALKSKTIVDKKTKKVIRE